MYKITYVREIVEEKKIVGIEKMTHEVETYKEAVDFVNEGKGKKDTYKYYIKSK